MSGPVSFKWQGWSVARSGLHGNQGSDLLGAGRPPMAMNCTVHTHNQSPLSFTSPLLELLKMDVYTHNDAHSHTKTHTLVVMWVDKGLSKGHGQSQAAQTTCDPEKRPLSNVQSVTVLGQGLASWSPSSTHTLSRSSPISYR